MMEADRKALAEPTLREAAEQVCDYLEAWDRKGDPLDRRQAVLWARKLRAALREEGEPVWIAEEDWNAAKAHPFGSHLCFVRLEKSHEKHIPLYRHPHTEDESE